MRHTSSKPLWITLAITVFLFMELLLILFGSGHIISAQDGSGTLDAWLGTAFANEDERATAEAIIQAEIDAAVQATLFALTPSPTPQPTNVPIADTIANHNPYLGPEDAPITIVEFSDYLCGFCGRFHGQTLEPLLEHYGDLVRFVYREYPIIGGDTSVVLGSAAQCANMQGLYWEFAAHIWANQLGERQAYSMDLVNGWAEASGLDMADYNFCMENNVGFDFVVMDYEAGRAFNVTGTPTFFINGERFVGAHPLENFMNLIDRQLMAQGIEPPARPTSNE